MRALRRPEHPWGPRAGTTSAKHDFANIRGSGGSEDGANVASVLNRVKQHAVALNRFGRSIGDADYRQYPDRSNDTADFTKQAIGKSHYPRIGVVFKQSDNLWIAGSRFADDQLLGYATMAPVCVDKMRAIEQSSPLGTDFARIRRKCA